MEAMETVRLRELMVDSQLLARGVKDRRVLDAMKKIPRHEFVSVDLKYKAYEDMALPIGNGQTISQPYMVAVMTELLELSGGETTLEIGTGSGYQTAVLAELSGNVYTIDRIESLSQRARTILNSLGYRNISFKVGDGTLGWPDKAPFQRILVTAGAPKMPLPLVEQLEDGGILVAPVGDFFSQQLVKLIKDGDKLREEFKTPCVFVPLIGEYGWEEK